MTTSLFEALVESGAVHKDHEFFKRLFFQRTKVTSRRGSSDYFVQNPNELRKVYRLIMNIVDSTNIASIDLYGRINEKFPELGGRRRAGSAHFVHLVKALEQYAVHQNRSIQNLDRQLERARKKAMNEIFPARRRAPGSFESNSR